LFIDSPEITTVWFQSKFLRRGEKPCCTHPSRLKIPMVLGKWLATTRSFDSSSQFRGTNLDVESAPFPVTPTTIA